MVDKLRAKANAALLLMALIWAANFTIGKIALRYVSPLAFNALRFPLASAALFVVLRARGPLSWPERADLRRIVLLGLIGNVVYQQFFTFGLASTRAGSAAILLSSTPLITAILSAVTGHERVRPAVWAGVVGTVIGIALVVLFGPRAQQPGENTVLGALLMFSASITWAFYTVGSRRLVDKYGALPMTAWTLWIGTFPLMLIGARAVAQTDYARMGVGPWLALIYAGVVSIAVAYLIWYYGVEILGNTRTSTYSNLVPVLSLGIAWLWLHEVPAAGQLAGAAVIIAGVTLAQASNRG